MNIGLIVKVLKIRYYASIITISLLFMAKSKNNPVPIIDNIEFIGNPFKQIVVSIPEQCRGIENQKEDLEFSLKFLYSYNGSKATFNSYRREIERLLQWSWNIARLSISELKRHDIEEYIEFCKTPPKHWIGLKNVARFKSNAGHRIANPEWKPFVVSVSKTDHKKGLSAEHSDYELSQAAVKAIFTALSSFYEFLIQEGLTESNPIALIRQKSKFIRKESRPTVRRISTLQWEYVIETAELMAQENPDEHERTLFMMNCFFGMYLRISELAADERSTPMMDDFRKDHDGSWWFHVLGKGNKNRIITVCDEVLNALGRYRGSRGLSRFPVPGEYEPLIIKSKGKGPISSTRHIRRIVQHCFDTAFERMKSHGLQDDAMELKAATVHWLRHTGISEDVKNRPREHVRDDAGHASMATTDRYIDSDLRERHQSGRKKKIKE